MWWSAGQLGPGHWPSAHHLLHHSRRWGSLYSQQQLENVTFYKNEEIRNVVFLLLPRRCHSDFSSWIWWNSESQGANPVRRSEILSPLSKVSKCIYVCVHYTYIEIIDLITRAYNLLILEVKQDKMVVFPRVCWCSFVQVWGADSALRHADSRPQEAQELFTSRGQEDREFFLSTCNTGLVMIKVLKIKCMTTCLISDSFHQHCWDVHHYGWRGVCNRLRAGQRGVFRYT